MATQNQLTPESVQLIGGLDFASPRPSVAPGSLIDCYNFIGDTRLGYKRVDGIEIFDGTCSSSLTYSSLYTFLMNATDHQLESVTAGMYVYYSGDTKDKAFGVVTSVESGSIVNVVITDLIYFKYLISAGVNLLAAGMNFDSDSISYPVINVEEYAYAHSTNGITAAPSITTVADSVNGAVAENLSIEKSKKTCVTHNYADLSKLGVNTATGLCWYKERLYAINDLDLLLFYNGSYEILPNDTITVASTTLLVRDIKVTSGDWVNGNAAGQILFSLGDGTSKNARGTTLTLAKDDTINLTRGTVSQTNVASIDSQSNATGVYAPWMAGLSYSLNEDALKAITTSDTTANSGFADVDLGYAFSYKSGTASGPPAIAERGATPTATSKIYTADTLPSEVYVDASYAVTDDSLSSIPGQSAALYKGSSAVQAISASGDGNYLYSVQPGKATPTQQPCKVQVSGLPIYFDGFDFSALTGNTFITDVQVKINYFANAHAVAANKFKFSVDMSVDGINYSAAKTTALVSSTSSAAPDSATLGGASDVWSVPNLSINNISNLVVRVKSNYSSTANPPNADLLYIDKITISVGYQQNYGIYYFYNGTDDVVGVISNVYLDASNAGSWASGTASGVMQAVQVAPLTLNIPGGVNVTTSTSGGTGLSASTAYNYVVTALATTGETSASSEVVVTTGTGSTNSNTITWSASTGATGYKIYRGTTPGVYTSYYTVGAVTTYTDTGATPTGSGSPPTTNTATNTARARITSGDKIYTAPAGGGALIATVSSDMTYAGLAPRTALDANSSRYEIIVSNFYGAAEWEAFYGCNGAGRAFGFDGTYLRYIYTGLADAADIPRHVASHDFHLLLGYATGACLSSVAGDPENFSGVDGAAEFDTGDAITGFLRLSGTALGIFCAKSIRALNGTDNTNFSLSVLSPYEGAIEYTIVDCGKPVWTSYRGISTLDASSIYGNFSPTRLSKAVNPWLISRILNDNIYSPGTSTDTVGDPQEVTNGVLFGIGVRNLNQYRLAFKDGYWLTLSFNPASDSPEFTIQKYYTTRSITSEGGTLYYTNTIFPLAYTIGVDSSGRDRNMISVDSASELFISTSNSKYNTDYQYIWELDRGWGFGAATPVEAWLTTTQNFFDNPFQLMTIRNIRAHGQSLGLATVDVAASADYLYNDFTYGSLRGEAQTNTSPQDISLPRDGGLNPFAYRLGDYGGQTNIASVGKTGRCFSFQFSTNPSTIEPPFVLQQLLLQLSSGKADIK